VISRALALVEPGGRLRRVSSQPPLTLRQLSSEDRQVCVLCQVGSAAGPLSGDEVTLDLTVCEDARAELTASGSAIAQGLAGRPPSRLSALVTVGARASLCAEPPALIACEGSSVQIRVSIELAADATIRWRELIVLGRRDEPGGSVGLRWSVRRSGKAVFQQSVELTSPELTRWAGMLGPARVMASMFVSGPAVVARTLVDAPTAVCQRIDDQTVLLTVLDRDAAAAERRLAELSGAVEGLPVVTAPARP
jgi:urease accessory protein